MQQYPPAYRTESKILGPDGRPWQESHGYSDGIDLPHVLTFNSLIASAWRTYFHGHQDDATKYDPQFAEAMRRDPQMMALLQERKMATVSLKWHLEVEDDRDPQQKAVCDGMTTILKQTPRPKTLLNYLLESIWYGKYGSQYDYEWRQLILPDPLNPTRKIATKASVVNKHVPLEGDKIGYHFDGTPYIRVHGGLATQIPQAQLINSTIGKGLDLTGSWRRKFVIHQHEILDAPFMSPDRGSAIYGIGIRHVLYWLAWLKKELIANILDYCERTGLGLRVWYYDAANPNSKAEVEKAASLQTNRTNVIVPRFRTQTGASSEGVEFVDTGSQGANLLLTLLQHWDADVERYVIGQTLSAGTEGSGLGGSGVAGMHAETKHRLVSFDADNLAETLTQDWVRPVLRWTYPKFADMPLAWVFDTNTPDPANKLDAISKAWNLGVTFEENSVRALTGMPAPQQGDKPISQAALQATQQPPPGAAAGAPAAAGIPGDGDGDSIAHEDEAGEPTADDYQQLVQHLTGAQ